MSWLSQQGPKAKKHADWPHPVTTLFIHYSSVAISTILAHDWMVDQYKKKYPTDDSLFCSPSPLYRQNVAQFLSIYFICVFAWRLAIHWNDFVYCEFYKQTFLCSVTLFNAAIGLYSGRPIIATAFSVAVGIDQLLWYVDLAVFFVRYVSFLS
jgi:hypothetical protein